MFTQEKVFVIFRQHSPNQLPFYERFKVPIKFGLTVLDALFYIQDHYDNNLAFRYSCRGAICGSCGLTINKFPRLACKTQIEQIDEKISPRVTKLVFGKDPRWDQKKEILVEPLPNMKVIKDLVVDMSPFWKAYQEIRPYFSREIKDTPPESLQRKEDTNRIEPLIYCILCGLCWTCPVSGKNKNYLGPSALAKASRFIEDTRLTLKEQKEFLTRVMKEEGIPACEKVFACNIVCPKGVMPGTAIDKIRKLEK